jgi:uncharacterized membrane protein YkvA (DUF1232 family)
MQPEKEVIIMARIARRGIDLSLLTRIRKIPAYMTDPSVGWGKKAAVILGLLYVISPLDAVPDWFPIVGWLDDIGVLGLLSMYMMRQLSEYIVLREERNERLGAESPLLR